MLIIFSTFFPNKKRDVIKFMEKNFIEILPALAVRKESPIPNNDLRIEVGREMSLHALNLAETKYDSNIVLLIQENPIIENITPSDVLTVGVLAKITLKVKLPSGNYKVKFRLLERLYVDLFLRLTVEMIEHILLRRFF